MKVVITDYIEPDLVGGAGAGKARHRVRPSPTRSPAPKVVEATAMRMSLS
jgi:hypothetical protein